MKKFFPLAFVLLLIGCGDTIAITPTLQEYLGNPLFAEQYYDILLDRMVELQIQHDPILEKGGKASLVEDLRRTALEGAKGANKLQRDGTIGAFIPAKEEANGEALLLGTTLFFSPTFETFPGPALHVYLSTVVDPRDVEFPDESAMDLGLLLTPFGAQAMTVPTLENPLSYRTVALWDKKLERLYAFAQLNK